MNDSKWGRVLVIDDDLDVLQAATLFLKQHVERIASEKDPDRIPILLKNESFDLILLDMNFRKHVTSGQEGFHWLKKILEIDPLAVIILITAFGDVDMAVRAIKEGATDFVLKPWQNEKLLATVSAALNLRRSRLDVARLQFRQERLSADLDSGFQDFIGSSSAMQKVWSTIEKVAGTDANVLILGENGTGKELVARALHRRSQRGREVFIGVDMGAISETLFESELFGHVRGAFTDARIDRPGRFEVASGGTLFLDEIGNLSLPLQAKILRVLEKRQLVRVGANQPIDIDVRLICASNLPIHEMVQKNEFRPDLLYRINTVEIVLPPLRDRSDDIGLIMNYYLERYCRRYHKDPKSVNAAAQKKLQQHRWPGNVRELKHTIERAVILSEARVLGPDDFHLPDSPSGSPGLPADNLNIEEAEKTMIRQAMARFGGNISLAAKELGLSRASLYRRLEKYGIR